MIKFRFSLLQDEDITKPESFIQVSSYNNKHRKPNQTFQQINYLNIVAVLRI